MGEFACATNRSRFAIGGEPCKSSNRDRFPQTVADIASSSPLFFPAQSWTYALVSPLNLSLSFRRRPCKIEQETPFHDSPTMPCTSPSSNLMYKNVPQCAHTIFSSGRLWRQVLQMPLPASPCTHNSTLEVIVLDERSLLHRVATANRASTQHVSQATRVTSL